MSEAHFEVPVDYDELLDKLGNNPEGGILFTPDDFYDLLAAAIDFDDQTIVAADLHNLVSQASVEFAEPTFTDDEFTRLADRIEREISDFIMGNKTTCIFELMGAIEHSQISAMYNPNNMLYFAKELAERSETGLTLEHLDKIYRYRVILKRLVELADIIADASAQAVYTEDNNHKDGARTWAGRVRPYGLSVGGRIDPVDHRDFDDELDDDGLREILIDGDRVHLTLKGGHYAANVESE